MLYEQKNSQVVRVCLIILGLNILFAWSINWFNVQYVNLINVFFIENCVTDPLLTFCSLKTRLLAVFKKEVESTYRQQYELNYGTRKGRWELNKNLSFGPFRNSLQHVRYYFQFELQYVFNEVLIR